MDAAEPEAAAAARPKHPHRDPFEGRVALAAEDVAALALKVEPSRSRHIRGAICFRVLRMEGELPNTDRGGASDPFVKITALGRPTQQAPKEPSWTSHVIQNELEPTWDQVVRIPLTLPDLKVNPRAALPAALKFSVLDFDLYAEDDNDLLAEGELKLNGEFCAPESDGFLRVPLLTAANDDTGEAGGKTVHIVLGRCVDESTPAAAEAAAGAEAGAEAAVAMAMEEGDDNDAGEADNEEDAAQPAHEWWEPEFGAFGQPSVVQLSTNLFFCKKPPKSRLTEREAKILAFRINAPGSDMKVKRPKIAQRKSLYATPPGGNWSARGVSGGAGRRGSAAATAAASTTGSPRQPAAERVAQLTGT